VTFKQIVSKMTVQAVLAVIVTVVTSVGFLMGSIAGETYIALALMAFAWSYKSPSGTNQE
jgi:hypothetical protein